ncbi:hypothetical protein QBC37DRAFT_279269 [Rhypophila decipiens]|uniref:Uncharacterized protein n=1 Tax=Rhypophila decipiens TaxID=261697 RepID=A0AAN6YDD0_9PEZI|nr:hypothetical protein QBC37DRAFT_279269 [Rhypophila decipiens]
MWLTKASLFLLAAASFVLADFPYTGPCSDKVCGASGKPCRTGLNCVPWPTFERSERKGCTCSYM